MPNRKLLEAQAKVILEQLAKLDSLPKEPDSPWADGKKAIYFEITYKNYPRRKYSYSAHLADNGLWYTTARQMYNNGTNLRDGLSWDDLMTWIASVDANAEVWLVVDMERLS